tara:strand:- start:43 stop:534 length:492 start_codon:yes stop_codon:yes gene_type:complete
MFFWYVGLSFLIVARVFVSPVVDYRLVILGALCPTLEMFFGGPWVLHSLATPVALMVIVMLVFSGKRLKQRKWLGFPIGMFLYLVLDRAWTRTSLFWWPLSGLDMQKMDTPEWESIPVLVLMEIVGLIAVAYSVNRYKLLGQEERVLFFTKGHIKRTNMIRKE